MHGEVPRVLREGLELRLSVPLLSLEVRYPRAVHKHVQHRFPLNVFHGLLVSHNREVMAVHLQGESKTL
ncbi:hypothetical protein DPMN_040045 [Dreissena polymorpha]|uniref:Uncharacterized protein n=1 Tax=Dreissena polymorpha TaxID=45954 RepID=A0A9D4HUX8_DREPO|nr:hypothetical protein DPMN_040045 [Dreissena polymorpha]